LDPRSGFAHARKVFAREGRVWREDKKRTGRNFRSLHAIEPHYLHDIHDASDLLRTLVEDGSKAPLFAIPGVPSREVVAQEDARVSRTARNFIDAEKHLVWLDGDGLPLPDHLIEDVQDHPDFPAVVAAWPRIVEWIAREGLPECFHGVTILAYPTSKQGLMAHDRAFIRLCFWSARPLASAQCKALVAWINAECLRAVAEWREYAIANPTWQPFDDKIYSPEHIILTAEPELIDRDRGGVAVSCRIGGGSLNCSAMMRWCCRKPRWRVLPASLSLSLSGRGFSRWTGDAQGRCARERACPGAQGNRGRAV
jgi:hypothetical protein